MALFSKRVAVNLDDVSKFKQSTESFAQLAYNVGGELVNSLEEMETEVFRRASELEKIAASFDQLYSSIKQLEREVEHNIAALKEELRNTPKELEKKSTDSDGNETVKKVPNPEYKKLEARLQKESNRLSSVKALSWKVYNEVSYSHRVAGDLASYANELKQIAPELQSNSRDVIAKAEKALRSLESNIRAINYYVSFHFRA